MAKRKCKPVEHWVQLHLFEGSEDEIKRRTFIEEMRVLPCLKDWKPKEVFRAGVAAD